MTHIRPARADELVRLGEIEQEADLVYAEAGLPLVLDMPTAAQQRLAEGPVWVAADVGDRPVGFALAGAIDEFALLDQISVLPAHGRKGIGGALIRQVEDWARRQGFAALVLFTYRDLAWNQPFYERQGFSEMPRSAWSDDIRTMWDEHVQLGHDPARRVVMWKRLS